MTRHALGIDIGEAQVSGVALTRQGRSLQLTGSCRVELAADTDPAGVAAAVRQVGAQLGGPQAVTVLGLPLSQPPAESAHAALLRHLSQSDPAHFQPSNINFSLFAPLQGRIPKKQRAALRAEAALSAIELWRQSLQSL